MIRRENGERFKYYYRWNKAIRDNYNYSVEGLLKHIMSPSIVNSKNKFLQYILKYFETSLVFLMHYVDRLKHFKNYHWKNR